ncbi:MAG: hypothetical protein QJT80_04190 [Candidatus Thiocaldithrix dubininis]|uniref:Uncharacterized protein n=1 Tax=Candidatus Thiocaldithrix dubininis TaxID=3080823 RepID=A0AA95H6B7_9GAMM|nr:MAG: hypothetical protein QJT80_04190 [Candidatus Thiocaldithrix dubininis]
MKTRILIKTSQISSALLFFALFMVLYGPRLKVIDLMSAATTITSIIVFLKFFSKGKIFYGNLSFTIIYCFLIFSYALVHYSFSTNDTTGITLALKLIIYAASAQFIISSYQKRYGGKWLFYLLNHIVICTVINGLFVIIFFLFPTSASLAASILDYTNQNDWIITQHRIFDLSMGGGSSGSYVFSIVFIIGLFKLKHENNKLNYIYLFIILLSTALMGRAGFYFELLYILLFLFTRKISIGLFLFYISLPLILITLSLNIEQILQVIKTTAISNPFFAWSFEALISYIEFQEFTTGSQNALNSMWHIPSNQFHLFFGDGNFGRTEHLAYVASDIGYVRLLYALGIFGTILIIAPIILLIVKIINQHNKDVINFKWIAIVTLASLFIFNLKELHIASRGSGVLIFLIIYVAISLNKEKINA